MDYNEMKRSEKDYVAFSNMKDKSIEEVINEEKTLLEKATEIVEGSREADYGSAYSNMKHIADIFNAITGRDLTPEEIAILNISQKLSRELFKHKEDNFVDIIGYIEVWNKVLKNK